MGNVLFIFGIYGAITFLFILGPLRTFTLYRMDNVCLGTGEYVRTHILEVAKKRDDTDTISKLAGYEDLFAYDAKYHKTCYSHYISERNIRSHKNKMEKKITGLPKIVQKAAKNVANLETSSCSSVSNHSNTSNHFNNLNILPSDMQILHSAAGILRTQMAEFQIKNNFPTPRDINKTTFETQVPPMLLTFISWLIDGLTYKEANNDKSSKAAIPCNIIMGLFNKNFKKFISYWFRPAHLSSCAQ